MAKKIKEFFKKAGENIGNYIDDEDINVGQVLGAIGNVTNSVVSNLNPPAPEIPNTNIKAIDFADLAAQANAMDTTVAANTQSVFKNALEGGTALSSISSDPLIGGIAFGAGFLGNGIASILGNKKAKQQAATAQAEATMQKYANIATNKQNIEESNYMASLLNNLNNQAALGGTFSGMQFPIFTTFDGGGTHEQNPYGGIPVGIAPDGQPNFVEEGEVKYKDFIFSDRLTISDIDLFNFPKSFLGLSYADAAKRVHKESDERPLDPISQRGLNDSLFKLFQSQEMEKQILNQDIQNVFANGGTIHINPKNKGKFTAKAEGAGESVQEFAKHVLANKDNYSEATVKQRNAAHRHGLGDYLGYGLSMAPIFTEAAQLQQLKKLQPAQYTAYGYTPEFSQQLMTPEYIDESQYLRPILQTFNTTALNNQNAYQGTPGGVQQNNALAYNTIKALREGAIQNKDINYQRKQQALQYNNQILGIKDAAINAEKQRRAAAQMQVDQANQQARDVLRREISGSAQNIGTQFGQLGSMIMSHKNQEDLENQRTKAAQELQTLLYNNVANNIVAQHNLGNTDEDVLLTPEQLNILKNSPLYKDILKNKDNK